VSPREVDATDAANIIAAPRRHFRLPRAELPASHASARLLRQIYAATTPLRPHVFAVIFFDISSDVDATMPLMFAAMLCYLLLYVTPLMPPR